MIQLQHRSGVLKGWRGAEPEHWSASYSYAQGRVYVLPLQQQLTCLEEVIVTADFGI